MENHQEVLIYFKESILKDISNFIHYKNMKTLNFTGEYNHKSLEEFVVGCVCHYLRQLRHQEDLSGLTELGRSTKLQNNIKGYIDKISMKPVELAQITEINPANISLILQNKNQPGLEYFMRIWIALGCPNLTDILYRLKE